MVADHAGSPAEVISLLLGVVFYTSHAGPGLLWASVLFPLSSGVSPHSSLRWGTLWMCSLPSQSLEGLHRIQNVLGDGGGPGG